jgi:hypothetical protein
MNEKPRIRASIAEPSTIPSLQSMGPIPTDPGTDMSVQNFGLLDQLHSHYADRAKMELAIGLSDADDIIAHVMRLRREKDAARSDVATAMSMLKSVLERLDGMS